jgi:hypothetical protein
MTHNCEQCIDGYLIRDEFKKFKNCYPECSDDNYYYFDSDNNYYCTTNKKCPEGYKLYYEGKKCIDSCQKVKGYQYEFRNKCYNKCPNEPRTIQSKTIPYYCEIECPEDTPYEIVKTQECVKSCNSVDYIKNLCILNNQDSSIKEGNANEMISDISKSLEEGSLPVENIKKGGDIIITSKNGPTITITTTSNQNNYKGNQMSTIELGECEDILKENYKIPKDEDLYIYKVDIKEKDSKVPKIEYEVFYPIDDEDPNKLFKLDLNLCKDINIGFSIPLNLDNANLEKFNSSSDYYNDIQE